MSYFKTILTIWQNLESSGQKSQFSNFLENWENLEVQSRLFKNLNFPFILWMSKKLASIHRPRPTFQNPNLDLWINWEKLCLNLSLTVENNSGNSLKKRWPHFKLNINDWNILWSKLLRIYQWIGKNIFHWWKWNKPRGNSAYTTEYLAKSPWKYLFLAYLYIALVNELKRLKC